jgi:hypothetical protein
MNLNESQLNTNRAISLAIFTLLRMFHLSIQACAGRGTIVVIITSLAFLQLSAK